MAAELAKFLARSQIRASDDERERAVDALRDHFAAGRIPAGEFEERVEIAYRATTRGELDALLVDLPSGRGRRAAERMNRANRAAWRVHAATYTAVNGGLVGIWGVTGGGDFWPGWPMAWWGMFLGWHWLASRAMRRTLGRRRGRSEVRGRPSRPLPR